MKFDYNIGLDIGTNSIGWAVIDNNYNLVKIKNKKLWGTRITEEVETAEATRIYRTTRRRYKRRKQRILKLQNLFLNEINKIDENFFEKLNESFLHSEDREFNKGKYTLFNDNFYNDKDFYNEYKTIYHLREMLINNKEKVDIRLIYLALHNIIKYRGHFLNEGQNLQDSGNPKDKLNDLKEILSLYDLQELNINSTEFVRVIADKTQNRKMKIESLVSGISDKNSKKFAKAVLNGIFGLEFILKDIFSENNNLADLEKEKIKFSDASYEEKEGKLENILKDKIDVIRAIQGLYSAVTLNEILKGEKYISKAMVKSFETYKYQLNLLKNLLKKYDQKNFKDIFKNNKNSEGYFFFNKNKGKYSKKFYENLKTVLGNIEKIANDEKDLERINYIREEIENESLLIKQNTTLNSSIPYQLNLKELKIIIENQMKYYPFLESEKEKIEKILTFKIPYYVGPLSKKNNKNAWAVRKNGMENIKIEPWNFEDIIDNDKSAELFIKKMLGKCTYFQDEYVIPKNSLLASDYIFYNEINKIKFSSENKEYNSSYYLDKDEKEKLRKVFLKKSKVKENDIKEWAAQELNLGMAKEIKLEGLQGNKEATSSLKPYIDFEKILGHKIEKKDHKMVEEIILWITIFQYKKIVERKIRANYSNLSEKQIASILNLKYKGWLRLSEKLLNGIKTTTEDARKLTVIDILREGGPIPTRRGNSHENLMQILNNNRYDFKKILEKEALSKDITEKSYNMLMGDLQVSPALKRVTWQAIKLIDEIIKIIGTAPKNIFLEVARSDKKSKRTTTKTSVLEGIYKEQKLNKEVAKELKNIKQLTEKQELYFRQEGKCMYTLEPLNIDSLYEYDVDHIIPRSYIKDDSIENKVLVKRQKNQDRSNNITPMQYIDTKSNKEQVIALWERLKENKLIGDKKLRNLKLYNISDDQEFGFIARQLVETRQITKNISNLLQMLYKEDETQVINVKASIVDDFRKQFDAIKNRNINNFHHAKDAYIVSIIGLYVRKRFPNFEEFYMKEFIKKEFKKYKQDKNTLKYKYGFIVGSMNKSSCDENGEVIWDGDIISRVKKQLSNRDILITKQLIRSKGKLFNDGINAVDGKESLEKRIPIKKGLDVYKYGYYTNEQIAYNCIIEHTVKGKKEKCLVGIPIRFDKNLRKKEFLIEYLKGCGYKDVVVIKDKVLKNQLFMKDNGLYYLASTTEWHNAKELILSEKSLETIKSFENKAKQENIYLMSIEKDFANIVKLKSIKNLEKLEKEFNKVDLPNKLILLSNFIDAAKEKDNLEEIIKLREIIKKEIEIVNLEKKETLIEVIDEWLSKVDREYKIFKKIYVDISKEKENIKKLKIENILKIIDELFVITKANARNGNLKLINLGERMGRLNNKPTNLNGVKFINKSITGFYVSEEVF